MAFSNTPSRTHARHSPPNFSTASTQKLQKPVFTRQILRVPYLQTYTVDIAPCLVRPSSPPSVVEVSEKPHVLLAVLCRPPKPFKPPDHHNQPSSRPCPTYPMLAWSRPQSRQPLGPRPWTTYSRRPRFLGDSDPALATGWSDITSADFARLLPRRQLRGGRRKGRASVGSLGNNNDDEGKVGRLSSRIRSLVYLAAMVEHRGTASERGGTREIPCSRVLTGPGGELAGERTAVRCITNDGAPSHDVRKAL